jgi:hypothetical protein
LVYETDLDEVGEVVVKVALLVSPKKATLSDPKSFPEPEV